MDLKNIIRKILLEQVSIPIYKEANPYKKIYANLKQVYSNTPDYILKEFFNTQILTNREALNAIINKYKSNPLPVIDDFYDSFLKGPWKLKVLNVNPTDFDDPTLQAFIDREFGDVNAYLVPDDEKRMQIQKSRVVSDGTNEPVITIYHKKTGKYELFEGWHRTMSILLTGDNGEDLKNWNKVKLRSFVLETE
jgi:hypothetical protein